MSDMTTPSVRNQVMSAGSPTLEGPPWKNVCRHNAGDRRRRATRPLTSGSSIGSFPAGSAEGAGPTVGTPSSGMRSSGVRVVRVGQCSHEVALSWQ